MFKLNAIAKGCALAALSCSPFAQATENVSTNEQPNIIVIMADDLGQWATSFRNQDIIETPNLDYLAENGVRFENGMTPAPVSSAARASFHTGKMPSQHGVYDFLAEDPKFDANWLDGEKLLSERMKDEGYRTALMGKWHATTDSKDPIRGFDRWLSYDALEAGWKNQYLHSGTVLFSSDGENMEYTGIQAQFLTDETLKFIDQDSEQPFFVSLNYVEPHFPFEGLPERLVTKYRGIAHKVVAFGGNSVLEHMSDFTLVPDAHEEKLAQYLAAVTLLDDQLGKLIDGLEGRDLLDNTVIAFVSDHGLLMGQYGLYGKVNASFPYNYYEETVRIPFVVSGPEKYVRPKQVRGEFVDLIDLHATVLDLAAGQNQTYDSSYGPGKTLLPMLKGERVRDWREYQFAERGNSRMISNGHWKLIRYYPNPEVNKEPEDHWYDLSNPMGERYLSEPPREELRVKMIADLDAFFKQYSSDEYNGLKMWEQAYPNFTTEDMLKHERWN
ncbi:sulfatase-like hydrolase/transferase [Photobacterium sp. BZF1]|uniref:sulfatase family protein n=1 Tax=Photobacterium sp. BZF1 TaxID=1904457 RepID=UPI0016537B84|nr:sulfatase-like hydrolase/transferase [Photobacterium sp. BZF1]MBC7002844.1 sulfatase-like hydrolase/transferase [Photobacterium sp. BZF1]